MKQVTGFMLVVLKRVAVLTVLSIKNLVVDCDFPFAVICVPPGSTPYPIREAKRENYEMRTGSGVGCGRSDGAKSGSGGHGPGNPQKYHFYGGFCVRGYRYVTLHGKSQWIVPMEQHVRICGLWNILCECQRSHQSCNSHSIGASDISNASTRFPQRDIHGSGRRLCDFRDQLFGHEPASRNLHVHYRLTDPGHI